MSARSPIEQMVDALVSCTKCGVRGVGNCGCWVKVTLRCPQCGLTRRVVKDDSDLPGTSVVQMVCPDCAELAPSGADVTQVLYFDACGNQIHDDDTEAPV